MSFKFELNDGENYEFPTAKETGKLKYALYKTRKINKDEDSQEYWFALMEALYGEGTEHFEAWLNVPMENEADWQKEFYGKIDPKD